MAWVDDPDHARRPLALQAGQLVDRFGGQAVYGRPMGFHEMQQIILAENIERAYRGYCAALASDDGLAKWAADNPQAAELAAWALGVGSTDAAH